MMTDSHSIFYVMMHHSQQKSFGPPTYMGSQTVQHCYCYSQSENRPFRTAPFSTATTSDKRLGSTMCHPAHSICSVPRSARFFRWEATLHLQPRRCDDERPGGCRWWKARQWKKLPFHRIRQNETDGNEKFCVVFDATFEASRATLCSTFLGASIARSHFSIL